MGLPKKTTLRDEILKDQNIPSYAPLNLDRNSSDIHPDLVTLCSKGPSFVPVPIQYDWLQMQKDFDSFRN